jgi:hypothetical protein
MPRRVIEVEGQPWEVAPSGRVTQYTRDEFGIIFTRRGPERERRVVRFSPLGARNSEAALAELTDQRLHELFQVSQPSWTAPETEYRR